jgi:lysyl oxidase-like protein 2/3/4
MWNFFYVCVYITDLPDLIPNLQALQDSVMLQDRPLYYLQCALEENCLSSSAYEVRNTSRESAN